MDYNDSHAQKPMYDYEIEFYEDFVSNSVSLGEDNCPNGGLAGTPLPFKVRNCFN